MSFQKDQKTYFRSKLVTIESEPIIRLDKWTGDSQEVILVSDDGFTTYAPVADLTPVTIDLDVKHQTPLSKGKTNMNKPETIQLHLTATIRPDDDFRPLHQELATVRTSAQDQVTVLFGLNGTIMIEINGDDGITDYSISLLDVARQIQQKYAEAIVPAVTEIETPPESSEAKISINGMALGDSFKIDRDTWTLVKVQDQTRIGMEQVYRVWLKKKSSKYLRTCHVRVGRGSFIYQFDIMKLDIQLSDIEQTDDRICQD